MHFKTLNVQHFLAIEKAQVSLCDQGLVLVQGVNDDDSSASSNGVGKSSIVDALCWCLYGETARGVSGDGVVNVTAKKDCQVSVFVEDDGRQYRISRYRKDAKFKNQTMVVQCRGDDEVDLTGATEKDTQKVINRIVGCPLSVFQAAIYAGQENMPDLPAMTDKHLKVLIEEASGIGRLEESYAIARTELRETQKTIDILKSNVEATQGRIDELNGQIENERKKSVQFEKEREEKIAGSERSKSVLLGKILDILKTLQVSDTGKMRSDLNEKKAAILERISRSKAAMATYNNLGTQVELKKRELNSLNSTLDTQNAKAKELYEDYKHPDKAIEKPCPMCGRSGKHDVEVYKAHVMGRLKSLYADIKKTKEQLERTEAEYSELKKKEVKAGEGIEVDVSSELKAVDEKIGLLNDIGRIKNEIRLLDEKTSMIRSASNPCEVVIKTLSQSVGNLETSLKEAADRLKESEKLVKIQQDTVFVFSPSGVRSLILDTVTPFLNERTSDYLSVLSDGNITATWTTTVVTGKGEVKDKFQISVENAKGGKTFQALSGGEKRKVRLATTLALQDLVASRATKPINLWIGDEIDNALDIAGLERLMGILEKKSREKGTVLIVSHTDLRDWCDNVITVRKLNGMSTIEV